MWFRPEAPSPASQPYPSVPPRGTGESGEALPPSKYTGTNTMCPYQSVKTKVDNSG